MNVSDLDEFSEYTNIIWDEWCRRRGSELPIGSNLEWCAIRRWYTEGVPVRIVLRGILDCGGEIKGRTTLLYAVPAVDEAARRWASSRQL